jgi:hypothetical protein
VRNTVVNKVWETGADEMNIKNEIERLAREHVKLKEPWVFVAS